MCGINGVLRRADQADPVDRAEVLRTRDAMESRGPDGFGEWISPSGELGLGHRRLAIIDVSDAGLQPMTRADRRHLIVFNGEIYNYRELRRELEDQGVRFGTHTDTEVILALWARDGRDMFRRLRGMYALAIWDERERSLLLARDPYGIKPLYYHDDGRHFRFASQVKALEAGGGVPTEPEPAGVIGFLLWGSVPEPFTIRRDVRALPAGHHLEVRAGQPPALTAYHRWGDGAGEVTSGIAEALHSSVAAHLVSDVPVAIFLSAGLDSGLLAALVRGQLAEPPTTLTLRFDEFEGSAFDEAPLAAKVARSLGARHLERRVGRGDFLDLWPRALAAMDQPSIDGFNTFVVSRVAHEAGFKVVLSGLGGDELFGSYSSFQDIPRWCRWADRLRRIPGARAIWPLAARTLAPGKPKLSGLLSYGPRLAGAYLLRRALFLPEELPALIGREMCEAGLAAYDPVAAVTAALDAGGRAGAAIDGWEAVHRMESAQYMRNQLLRDSDWASMAHSLELRVPLVDARLREQLAAWSFEPARTHGKAALVREVAPALPEEIFRRRKSGFTIPVMEWLEPGVGMRTGRGGLSSRHLALRVLEVFGVVPGHGATGVVKAVPRRAAER